MKPTAVYAQTRGENTAWTCQLCGTQETWQAMPPVGQHLWLNRTALNCSVQFLQQSSMQAAKGFAQGVPKTCSLNMLASERRQACAVSIALFAVLSLALALQCSLITRSENFARDRPSPCPLTLTLTQTLTATAPAAFARGKSYIQISTNSKAFAVPT